MRRPGLGYRLAARRLFRLRLGDVQRRQRADLDARAVVLHELGGQRQRVQRDLFGLDREDEIPVRIAHVGDRPDDRRAQRRLGHLLVDLRDLELRPRGIGPEVAQQRLGECRGQRRVEHRVARGKQVRLLLAIVVERDRVAATAPLDVLRDAVVAGERVGAENVAAGGLAAGERCLAAEPERRDEVRAEGGVERREREIECLRREPFDRQVEIAVERPLDGAVERQLDADAGRRGRYGWSCLRLGVGSAGQPGFRELLCGFASDLLDTSRLRGVLCRSGGPHQHDGEEGQ